MICVVPLQGTGSLRQGRIRIERRRPPCPGQENWVCTIGRHRRSKKGKKAYGTIVILYPPASKTCSLTTTVPLLRQMHRIVPGSCSKGFGAFTQVEHFMRQVAQSCSHKPSQLRITRRFLRRSTVSCVSHGEPLRKNPTKLRRNSSKKQ